MEKHQRKHLLKNKQNKMKKKSIIMIFMIIAVISVTSCTTPRDAFGNKTTRRDQKALREIGCPGNQGMIGVH